MKIFVCVKHVPDTAASIRLAGETGFDDSEIKFIASPYDEYGIEEAVSLVEKNDGEVVIVTVGKDAAVSTIRSALSMGAHRAILVKIDSQFLDSSLTAKALKAAIEQDGAGDLIFTGKGSVDTESFQTQYRLAQLLEMPVVNEVSSLSIDDGKAVVEREIGSGEKQVIEMNLPCVIGADRGLNEPRYPKFPDIMKAKKKKIHEIEFSSLELDESRAMVEIEKLELVPERSGAKMIEGSVNDQADQIIKILRQDEKVL
jgi:electron transfer flavoprotein beta subunit